MKIAKWYRQNMLFPVLKLSLGFLAIIVGLNWFHFSKEYEQKQVALSDVVSLAELGYLQKNRDLVESSLNLSLTTLGSTQFTMCEEGKVLLSFPQIFDRCEEKLTSLSKLVIVKRAKSNPQVTFQFEFSRQSQWLYLLLSLVLLGGGAILLLFVLRRLRLKFEMSILVPLSGHSSTATEIDEIKDVLKKNKELEELRIKNALLKVASQVAHDIRSPLTGLNMILGSDIELPEEKRILLRAVSQRINDIANQLLIKSKEEFPNEIKQQILGEESTSSELLGPLLEMVVAEKKAEWKDKIHVTFELNREGDFGVSSEITPSELKRVLSNLLNNSLEALPEEKGRILVEIKSYSNKNVISIRDNGVGIPPSVLRNLGEESVSFSKGAGISGNGLGIPHAKKTVESLGGQLKIDSREGLGTEVLIELPRSLPPAWLMPTLRVSTSRLVVILDDDSSIHDVWGMRLSEFKDKGGSIINFQTESDFLDWILQNPDAKEKALFLMDYEILGAKGDGISLINKLGISDRSCLVTSRFEEPEVRARCQSLRLKLLPKSMAIVVPIEVADE
jgi:signal transduction histidine kinase